MLRSVYIDRLADLFNECNNIYHCRIKMRLIGEAKLYVRWTGYTDI